MPDLKGRRKQKSEMEEFLQAYNQQKRKERFDVINGKEYKFEIQSLFHATNRLGMDFTGYRMSAHSPDEPGGLLTLRGNARKKIDDVLDLFWTDRDQPIRVRFTQIRREEKDSVPTVEIKVMVVDDWDDMIGKKLDYSEKRIKNVFEELD